MHEVEFPAEDGREAAISRDAWTTLFGDPIYKLEPGLELMQSAWAVTAANGRPTSITVGYLDPSATDNVPEVEVHTLQLGVDGMADESLDDAAARLGETFMDIYMANRPGSATRGLLVGAQHDAEIKIDGRIHSGLQLRSGDFEIVAAQIDRRQLVLVGRVPISPTLEIKNLPRNLVA